MDHVIRLNVMMAWKHHRNVERFAISALALERNQGNLDHPTVRAWLISINQLRLGRADRKGLKSNSEEPRGKKP